MSIPQQKLSNSNVPKCFSSAFNISSNLVDEYGAIDVSLENDLPLFIDPFLLFDSDDEELKQIHSEIVRYLLFLKKKAGLHDQPPSDTIKLFFSFPEVKQTWLGFSETGNSGRGLGEDFGKNLYKGLSNIFRDFGEEDILKSPHMEKLSLISPNVGKDKISDFATNFAKRYLLRYTENFAKKYISRDYLKDIAIEKVTFDYANERWKPELFRLPVYKDDYVLLTPRSILTRDDTFINRNDMVKNISNIAPSIGNDALRHSLNTFIDNVFADERVKKKERDQAILKFILDNPELVNYYLKYKEDTRDQAHSISYEHVTAVKKKFIEASEKISFFLLNNSDFYKKRPTSFDEALKKVNILKHAIEDEDLYLVLWHNGEPSNERDVQLLFKLVWQNSEYDLNREVDNGRGSVDYVVSKGSADKAVVEFKLAKNTKIRQNLQNQVNIYKNANKTEFGLTVIVYYTEPEQRKLNKILNELELQGNKQIVTIDARRDNKVSASNVK